MAFIATTPTADASGETLSMYERQEHAWGFVPNYAKVFSHRPEVMARWGRLLAEIRRPSDDRRFELVTFAVAHELRHSACALAHGTALAEIIGDAAVLALARGEHPPAVSDAEMAVMRFARSMARDASRITAGQVEALARAHGLSDAEIFDVAAIAAARCFFTRLLDALGVEPDRPFLDIEDELRAALVVGRAISHRPPETLPEAATV